MSTRASRTASRTASFQSTSKSVPHSTQITAQRITTSKPPNYKPDHHVGSPPTSFKNPWPSSPPAHSLTSVLRARFFNSAEKNFVPVPTDRSVLVPVVTPDWGASDADASNKLKATWIGHASFLVEFPSRSPNQRGVRVLLDPVFSERMSPFTWLGPKRFTPPPCTLDELPEVDLVCISHNHYDHLDAATIKFIHRRGGGNVKFLCALGVGANLSEMGLQQEDIIEMDWWDGVTISAEQKGARIGNLRIVCTPCQHISGRWVNDHGRTLWCSFVLEDIVESTADRMVDSRIDTKSEGLSGEEQSELTQAKKLFFAGDTAYRSIPQGATEEEISKLPVCTAFQEVGSLYGPFDLALLPIGCYSPRWWMSAVHCAPEDSICIHKDVRSKRSIGMHYGVLRGGISQYYEDVTEPPKRWKESAQKVGLKWQDEIGLIGVGETSLV